MSAAVTTSSTRVETGPRIVATRSTQSRSRQTPRSAAVPVNAAGQPDLDYCDLDSWLVRLSEFSADDPRRSRLEFQIIAACLPLARHIAQRFSGRGESFEDLEQVARIGLINAVKRFDPAHGSAFLAYAVPTMMGEVRRHFRDRSWTVYVPRAAKENWLRVAPASEELTSRLGRAPTVKELAAELELNAESVTEALLAGYAFSPASLDVPSTDADGAQPLVDHLAAEDPGFEFTDQWLSVKPLIEALPPTERAVLVMRFGENLTQSQIAARIGCSQMHVSRMLAQTLATLRQQAT